jgi:hypothetical protein
VFLLELKPIVTGSALYCSAMRNLPRSEINTQMALTLEWYVSAIWVGELGRRA